MSLAAETLIAVAEQDPDTLELDLHGEGADNAVRAVDYFLDQSAHGGEQVVKVIYGVGTGKLAERIPKFVKSHASVEYAREALLSGEAGSVIYAALKN